MSRSWIVDRLGEPAFAQLAHELAGSELQSVLLEVMARRAEARTPAEVLAHYKRDPFVRPAAVDQRTSIEVDGHLFAAADGFEALELSPVAPLATCAGMGRSAQNRVLSALRGTEVVSDPTNVLALECAARGGEVHLATSHRVLRTQPFPRRPGFGAHFRLFALASAGIEARDHAFTVAAVTRHLQTQLAALDRLERNGYAFGARRVELLATSARAAVADRIAERLSGTDVSRKALEHAYYSGGLRYMIWVTAAGGGTLPLVDGGTFDWLARLTSNRRAVYVASGTGAQLIAFGFRAA